MILIFFRYLVGHYRNHHGGLPPGMEDREQFICEQCSQVFLSENSLHNHISNKHIKGSITQVVENKVPLFTGFRDILKGKL